MPSPAVLTREILERCRALGFACAGVCAAEPSRYARELRAWLAEGRHGSMAFMTEAVEQRLAPASLLPGARWMVMVADLYTERARAVDAPLPARHARIARYARGRNYHEVIKRRLHRLADALRVAHPGAEFRSFTDTAPVMERDHAARAGLGWIAKNTMLIHPRLGSYFVIGGLLTTLELETPAEQRVVADHCGTCTRCIDACPTGAIAPYRVDGSRCISYLTIERRAEIASEFFAPVGAWLYGCDVCQEVCPHNSARPIDLGEGSAAQPEPGAAPPRRKPGGWGQPRDDDASPMLPADESSPGAPVVPARPHADYTPRTDSLDVRDILDWTEDDRREAFTTSAMKRASLEMMKRNALIVAGNLLRDDPANPAHRDLEARVRRASEDPLEPELVRRTALEVLRNLGRA